MRKCEKCGKPLIPFKDVGYLHPSGDCDAEDGYVIKVPDELEDFNKKWKLKHDSPEVDVVELLEELEMLRTRNYILHFTQHDNQFKRLCRKMSRWLKRVGN